MAVDAQKYTQKGKIVLIKAFEAAIGKVSNSNEDIEQYKNAQGRYVELRYGQWHGGVERRSKKRRARMDKTAHTKGRKLFLDLFRVCVLYVMPFIVPVSI